MPNEKWETVREKLMLVEKWKRDGLTERQICKNLGICETTLNEYKKIHPELVAALKRGKEVVITELENALYKRARGYEYEETKTYIKIEDGREVKYTEKTKKHIPPDVAACSILLKNKDKGNWSDNPMKIAIEREMMEFKKKLEEEKKF